MSTSTPGVATSKAGSSRFSNCVPKSRVGHGVAEVVSRGGRADRSRNTSARIGIDTPAGAAGDGWHEHRRGDDAEETFCYFLTTRTAGGRIGRDAPKGVLRRFEGLSPVPDRVRTERDRPRRRDGPPLDGLDPRFRCDAASSRVVTYAA
ncbi:hypothetical protein ACFQE1_06960 [Halobium palmae]|uniref:Cupin domain-containing protein n=1 Tax=Halobium palmae TaxID=1776492 RepID=A0ABD5RZD3_9EURY